MRLKHFIFACVFTHLIFSSSSNVRANEQVETETTPQPTLSFDELIARRMQEKKRKILVAILGGSLTGLLASLALRSFLMENLEHKEGHQLRDHKHSHESRKSEYTQTGNPHTPFDLELIEADAQDPLSLIDLSEKQAQTPHTPKLISEQRRASLPVLGTLPSPRPFTRNRATKHSKPKPRRSSSVSESSSASYEHSPAPGGGPSSLSVVEEEVPSPQSAFLLCQKKLAEVGH